MNCVFATYLGTLDFIPGVLVLHHSLRKHQNSTAFVVLVSDDIASEATEFLTNLDIDVKVITPVPNPYLFQEDVRGFRYMYSKLRIFGMAEYDKIVYLDADMLVCNNIEILFTKPGMSAVSAGSILPEHSDWTHLNAGLMVIEPNRILFETMMSLIDRVESPDKSDQGFLQSLYPDWPAIPSLHLHHRFNVPAAFLDRYCRLPDHSFAFSFADHTLRVSSISVIHYWASPKPWQLPKPEREAARGKYEQSVQLWWSYFEEIENTVAGTSDQ